MRVLDSVVLKQKRLKFLLPLENKRKEIKFSTRSVKRVERAASKRGLKKKGELIPDYTTFARDCIVSSDAQSQLSRSHCFRHQFNNLILG